MYNFTFKKWICRNFSTEWGLKVHTQISICAYYTAAFKEIMLGGGVTSKNYSRSLMLYHVKLMVYKATGLQGLYTPCLNFLKRGLTPPYFSMKEATPLSPFIGPNHAIYSLQSRTHNSHQWSATKLISLVYKTSFI